MEYTIQKLADLAGVTTRTLRWYDQLGLLKPGRVAENGYRYYGVAEVDRLQQILFYRALGVELTRIKTILDDPSFDRLEALRSHLRALQGEQERIRALIRTVRETILTAERNEIMSDKAKFEAFKQRTLEGYEQQYAPEVREKYGQQALDSAVATIRGITQERYQEWTALGEEIQSKLEQAVRENANPAGESGKELAELHSRWLTFSIPYDPAKHRGIVRLYSADERFRAYYDKTVPGCAQFLQDAVLHWIS